MTQYLQLLSRLQMNLLSHNLHQCQLDPKCTMNRKNDTLYAKHTCS